MHGAAIINQADSHVYLEELETAVSIYQKAITVNQANGNILAALGATSILGELTAAQGKSQQAINICENGLTMAKQWTQSLTGRQTHLIAASPLLWGIGYIYYCRNQLKRAEPYLRQALTLYELGGASNLAEGVAAMAQLQWAKGNTDQFLYRLEQLQSIAASYPNGYILERVEATVLNLKLRHWQSSPDSTQAQDDFVTQFYRMADQLNLPPQISYEPHVLAVARAENALGMFNEAEKRLQQIMAVTKKHQRWTVT